MNDLFRIWNEVTFQKLALTVSIIELDAKNSIKNGFHIIKEEDFRKWYGNNDYVS